MIHVSEGQMYDMAKAQINNLSEKALYGFKLGMQRIADWYKIENPSPHVLTYEDLACQQGSELLNKLLPIKGFTWSVSEEGYDIGLFPNDEDDDNFNILDLENGSLYGFWHGGIIDEYPSWQLILAGYNDKMEQVGHDWELPNGETVKAIFLPKTQVND